MIKTNFIKGRSVADNIRLMFDVIEDWTPAACIPTNICVLQTNTVHVFYSIFSKQMLSQKILRKKSALMLEDATWFPSLLTTRKIQNNVEKMQKIIVEKCSQNFFYYTSYAFLKALDAFHQQSKFC